MMQTIHRLLGIPILSVFELSAPVFTQIVLASCRGTTWAYSCSNHGWKCCFRRLYRFPGCSLSSQSSLVRNSLQSSCWSRNLYPSPNQNPRTIVNFVDFILDENFNVKPAGAGIGRYSPYSNLIQLRYHLQESSSILGRRLQHGRLHADHHGNVRDHQILVAAGTNGPRSGRLGRRKRGDFVPHMALRRPHCGSSRCVRSALFPNQTDV